MSYVSDRCLQKVDKIIKQNLLVDDLLKKELPEIAKAVAKEIIHERRNDECWIVYDPNCSPELLIWALGLACESWSLGILRLKAKEGHCYAHTKPCQKGVEFHKGLFRECKKSFEEVLENASI